MRSNGSRPANAEEILRSRECSTPSCPCHHRTRQGEGVVHCPVSGHADVHPSFSVSTDCGKVLVNCLSGKHSSEETIEALQSLGLWPKAESRNGPRPRKKKNATQESEGVPIPVTDVTPLQPPSGLTLEDLARVKRLPIDLLKDVGCCNKRSNRKPYVEIPYYDIEGVLKAIHSLT